MRHRLRACAFVYLTAVRQSALVYRKNARAVAALWVRRRAIRVRTASGRRRFRIVPGA